jgi:hypothetical protein
MKLTIASGAVPPRPLNSQEAALLVRRERVKDSRFIGWWNLSDEKCKPTAAMLDALDALGVAESPDRIYAEIVAPRIARSLRKQFDEMRSPCLHRLLSGRCNRAAELISGRWHNTIPCWLPGFDHTSLWRRKSDGARMLMTQPYGIAGEDLTRIIEFAAVHDLYIRIDTCNSFHFPGATVSITLMRRADYEAGLRA